MAGAVASAKAADAEKNPLKSTLSLPFWSITCAARILDFSDARTQLIEESLTR
jgi:hypothetical protein